MVRRNQAAIAMRFPPWLAGGKLTRPSRDGTTCGASDRQHLFLRRFHQYFPMPEVPATSELRVPDIGRS